MLDNVLTMESWGVDSRQIRSMHPFYNIQTVWLLRVSPGMREWLRDTPKQRHFVYGATDVKVLSAHSYMTAFHRTPIEAAIESVLYGVGSWLSEDDRNDLSSE